MQPRQIFCISYLRVANDILLQALLKAADMATEFFIFRVVNTEIFSVSLFKIQTLGVLHKSNMLGHDRPSALIFLAADHKSDFFHIY